MYHCFFIQHAHDKREDGTYCVCYNHVISYWIPLAPCVITNLPLSTLKANTYPRKIRLEDQRTTTAGRKTVQRQMLAYVSWRPSCGPFTRAISCPNGRTTNRSSERPFSRKTACSVRCYCTYHASPVSLWSELPTPSSLNCSSPNTSRRLQHMWTLV